MSAAKDKMITGWSSDQLEDRLTLSYLLGQHAALEQLADQLRARAGEHFADGNDERAGWLRDLAASVVDARAVEVRNERDERKLVYEQEYGDD